MPLTDRRPQQRRRTLRAVVPLLVGSLLAAGVWAICVDPSTGPDVIVARLYDINNKVQGAAVDGKRSYSVGTESLNEGNLDLRWISSTNEHPVIGQNLYRLKTDATRPGGRLEQIGLSWLKHGFLALTNQNYCSCSFEPGHSGGAWLGQGCDDPYSGGLNGDRTRLGPRYQVNAATGAYTYPFDNTAPVDDELDRRIIVLDTDLDPAVNSGARYFFEGQYVTADDAAAGNSWNNASFREAVITTATSRFLAWATTGPFMVTQQRLPALAGWPLIDPSVQFRIADIVSDGRLHVAAKVHECTISDDPPCGVGLWRYEYAIHNLTSHRSVQRVEVPVPAGSTLSDEGFHDVDYHSGEPFANTDWTIDADGPNGFVAWFGDPYATDQNANALRWGTMYNFWFNSDQAPGGGRVELTLFRPAGAGLPLAFSVNLPVPGGSILFADDWETGSNSAWSFISQ